MKFGGIEPLSLSDYENEISTVLFTIGCPFRCKFCYNVDLLSQDYFDKSGRKVITEDEALEKIQSHIKMITAVSLTGGEPCANDDLLEFIKKLHLIGIKKIKVDTSGFSPDMIQACIDSKLVTRIAMDLKGPLSRYPEITGFSNISAIKKSIHLLKNSTIDREFRLTLLPSLTKDDIIDTISLVPGETIYLQQFEPEHAYSIDVRGMTPIIKSIIDNIVEETKTIANVKLRGF